MFDIDAFIGECQAAVGDGEPRRAIREVLERALSDPSAIAAALPPTRAEIERLHVADDLTVLKVVWGPGQRLRPHDHQMWAAIGIYGGQEDNAFFRRTEAGIVESGGKTLRDREVLLLGDDAVHAVTNPLTSFTGAIHIYGGNFFTEPRSEWDPDTLVESPMDLERTMREFEEANARAG